MSGILYLFFFSFSAAFSRFIHIPGRVRTSLIITDKLHPGFWICLCLSIRQHPDIWAASVFDGLRSHFYEHLRVSLWVFMCCQPSWLHHVMVNFWQSPWWDWDPARRCASCLWRVLQRQLGGDDGAGALHHPIVPDRIRKSEGAPVFISASWLRVWAYEDRLPHLPAPCFPHEDGLSFQKHESKQPFPFLLCICRTFWHSNSESDWYEVRH